MKKRIVGILIAAAVMSMSVSCLLYTSDAADEL